MNNKALTLSLLMAGLAVFFVSSYVSSIEEQERKRFGTELLVATAAKNINEMDTINEKMVQLKLIPKTFLEPSAISFATRDEHDKDVIQSLKGLSGAIALVPIKKDEQITFNKLSEPGVRTGLSPQVTPGKRGIAIPVNDTTGVGKLVKPGDRVDIVAILDPGGGRQNRIAKTVLQDVVVLATGKNIDNNPARTVERDPYTSKQRIRSLAEDSTFTNVTLEVEPSQAQMLALIIAAGDNSLALALRNNDDTDRVNLGSTTFGDVLGADAVRIQRPGAGGR